MKDLRDPKKIVEDIARVAKILKKHPILLTKAEYFLHGGKYNEWDLRCVGGFNQIKNTFFTIHDKNFSYIFDTQEIRRHQNRLEKSLGSQELFIERLQNALRNFPPIKVTPPKIKKTNSDKEERLVTLILSDLHFGTDLVKSEHLRDWGKVEEARCFAAVIRNVLFYKKDRRHSHTLVVNILGDIIENELHGRSSADKLHIQTCRAMYLLSQGLSLLASEYKKVIVNFAVGNHGRDMFLNPNRAIDQKFNAIETTIYYSLKLACRNIPNIEFNQTLKSYCDYKALGHRFYATHGDTHLNPGNVGKRVNLFSLENQINKINASLKDDEEYKVFMVGHVHVPLVTQLSNGSYLVINGALVPPNSYAQSLNIMESQQVQVLFESTKDFAVGDFRLINVNGCENDKSLDKLIKPFSSIEDKI